MIHVFKAIKYLHNNYLQEFINSTINEKNNITRHIMIRFEIIIVNYTRSGVVIFLNKIEVRLVDVLIDFR